MVLNLWWKIEIRQSSNYRKFGTICGGLCPPRIRRVLRRIRLCPRMSAYVRPTVRRGRCPRRTKKSAADSAAESANPRGSERIRRGLWRIRRGLADSPPRTAPEKVRRGLCPPHDVIRTIYAADNVRRELCPPRTKVRRAQCPRRTLFASVCLCPPPSACIIAISDWFQNKRKRPKCLWLMTETSRWTSWTQLHIHCNYMLFIRIQFRYFIYWWSQ